MKPLKAAALLPWGASNRSSNRSMADYLAVLCGTGMARVLALANNVLIARFLGSEGFGQFSFFYIVMLSAWVIPQAFDTTFVKFAKSGETTGRAASYWRANVQMKILYCGLMLLSAWPAGHLLAVEFFHKPDISELLCLGLVCGSLLSVMNSVASSLQVREKFGRFAVLQGLYTAITCLGLLFLFLVTPIREVGPVISLYLGVSALTAGISMVILLRSTPQLLTFEPEIMQRMTRFGKWIFFTALATYTFPRIDGMMLTRYLDLNTLGLYSVAAQFTMIIAVVTGSMSAVFLPRAMQALENGATLKQYIVDSARPVTIILLGIFLLEIAAPLAITIIYGPQYAAAAQPLRILLLGYLFSSLYLPLSFLYYSLDLPQIRFLLEAGKMLLALVLFIHLIPLWGMTGAAAAMTLALVTNSLAAGGLLYFLLRKHPSIRLRPDSTSPTLKTP